MNGKVCHSEKKWNHDECRCGCKELDDWDSCEKGYMCNTSTCDLNIIKHVKLTNIWILKIIGKLALEYENEILNTTGNLLNDKKVACAKRNCLI